MCGRRRCRTGGSSSIGKSRIRGELLGEIAAVQSCAVRRVDDDASVTEEGGGFRVGRQIEIEVRDLKVLLSFSVGDAPVFPTQIARLAGIGLRGVTGRSLVSTVGGKMAAGAVAVPTLRDGKFMNVIHLRQWSAFQTHKWFGRKEGRGGRKARTERTTRRVRECKEIDVEIDSGAIVVRDTSDLALDRFVQLQDGLEGGHGRIVLGDGGIGGLSKGMEGEQGEGEDESK